MDLGNGKREVVDPEVRAYVSSLVSALGGTGADENGRYVLGDDALGCLRDLKRWLKLYDEKANRLDVARCLAESNLVGGDLLQILAAWPEDATDDRLKSKIALACLELLVPLTWPMEKDIQSMTVNHHRHMPFLQTAQVGYKRSIINFDGARILHTAVRCALPSMAEDMSDRKPRDEGIIKLLLYFIRNIVVIAPAPDGKYEGDESEISRSATIDAFDYQDILHLLLTLSSTMGEDFNTQDVIVLDILFHLIKGVDVEKLFADDAELSNSKVDELVSLRKKEAAMLRSYQVNAPSRHNRFGGMAWLQRGDGKLTTVSGQAALFTDTTKTLAKIDSTKKYKPPRRALKGDSGPMDFDTPVSLNVQATKHLRSFVEEFLDSGFNPLFNHLRKAIDREAERVLEYHPRQFFYLVSWFLEAERGRRKSKKPSTKPAAADDVDDFALVASVLNQEMFVTLNRAMESSFENKSWQDLSAAMKCFTQILVTVQDMSESPLEEDQEIAENILNRIFYEETTHDRVANITRTYKDQGFGYLDSTTELAHNYLRILEQYSKQNVDLQVRSRRRVRRKKKAAKDAGNDDDDDGLDGSDAEDEARAERTTHERKFDFNRFAARFLTQGCVDTFVTFTAYYNDLKPAQLKRSHRYFYRVAFKHEMSVMLFRVDIIALFYKMIKGPEGLDNQDRSTFKEWDELVKQLLRRCTKKIQDRPELVVEMLFSKINSTAHYLEYGYEKQTVQSKPRPAAEMEVKAGMEWEEQIGVVVSAMLDRNEGGLLEWIKSQLSPAEKERRSWEATNAVLPSVENDLSAEQENLAVEIEPAKCPSIVVKPVENSQKIALFKNGLLRLLLNLIGFQRVSELDDPNTSWIIPSALSADQLKQSLDLINKFEFSPPVFDDGKEAGDLIRRKSAGTAARRAAFDDDDDDEDNGIDSDDESPLFPAGGPTTMKKPDALATLKKSRRRRRKEGSEDANGPTEEELNARAEARRRKELEKNRKIKSDLFVHDSDEDEDEERDRLFFQREEELRQKSKISIMKELLGVGKLKDDVKKGESKKRQSVAISVGMDEDSDEDDLLTTGSRKRQSSAVSVDSDEDDLDTPAATDHSSSLRKGDVVGSDGDSTDTPLSSPHNSFLQSKRRKLSGAAKPVSPTRSTTEKDIGEMMMIDGPDEEEDEIPIAPARRRVRAGFIIDSSDEE